jgi:hypothetical protein
MNTYTPLLKEFIQQIGAEALDVPQGAGLEFEHDDMLVKISPHPNQTDMVLEVAILRLDEDTPAELNAMRCYGLLQLNALALFSHGAAVSITADHLLTLGRILTIAATDATMLLDHFNHLIQKALELRNSWHSMGVLLQSDNTAGAAPRIEFA